MTAEKQPQQCPKHRVHQVQVQTEQKSQRPDTPDCSADDDYVYVVCTLQDKAEHKHSQIKVMDTTVDVIVTLRQQCT